MRRPDIGKETVARPYVASVSTINQTQTAFVMVNEDIDINVVSSQTGEVLYCTPQRAWGRPDQHNYRAAEIRMIAWLQRHGFRSFDNKFFWRKA